MIYFIDTNIVYQVIYKKKLLENSQGGRNKQWQN